ncbi:MAG: MFS transporter [Alphaproteobacteria bacterium]|nr:MFS transporter [Alphaproteobacteria bacterium]
MRTNDLTGRTAALVFIEKILDDHVPLDQAFDQTCRQFSDKLLDRDRSFVRYLGTTCLRHLGQLDAMINHCTAKKLGTRHKTVRNILRLAITQLLYMAVPAHAAVNCAVDMTARNHDLSLRHSKGMVNAILRRIERDRKKFSSDFSAELNLPYWLKQDWTKRYGRRAVAAMAQGLLAEPPLDFSLKPHCDGREWAQKLGGILLANGSIRVEKPGPVQNLAGYDDGMWWVQDVAASLPVALLGAKSGDKVLELCAAPGGKTAQLAACGCHVTAIDQSARRCRRLQENMTRLTLSCDIVTSDAADFLSADAACQSGDYSYILLDAPCSSTGTLRRHPDVSRVRSIGDIENLAGIQRRLLSAVIRMMPTGAVLVYCVCSLQAAEGPDQIKALLARDSSVKRQEITRQELTGFEDSLLIDGDVQTLPHHLTGGMDGFFISRLVKL